MRVNHRVASRWGDTGGEDGSACQADRDHAGGSAGVREVGQRARRRAAVGRPARIVLAAGEGRAVSHTAVAHSSSPVPSVVRATARALRGGRVIKLGWAPHHRHGRLHGPPQGPYALDDCKVDLLVDVEGLLRIEREEQRPCADAVTALF